MIIQLIDVLIKYFPPLWADLIMSLLLHKLLDGLLPLLQQLVSAVPLRVEQRGDWAWRVILVLVQWGLSRGPLILELFHVVDGV